MTQYSIDDKIVAKIATELTLGYVTVDTFNNAWYNAILKNSKGEIVLSEIITMTPEEYSQWGDNDDYVLQLTCTKLGIVIKPPVVSVSESVSDSSSSL